MNDKFRQTAALSLLVGSLLGTLAMALHPVGGDMAHIVHIRKILIGSHSIAIVCLPFMAYGAWGLAEVLQTPSRVAMLLFFVFFMGLIAVMIAGSINGLVLPAFAGKYMAADIDINVLKAIVAYGRYINVAMDYIFMGACMVAIGGWSAIVVVGRALPVWIGYYGFLVIALGGVGVLADFNFISVTGFSIFVGGLISWLVLAAILMSRKPARKTE